MDNYRKRLIKPEAFHQDLIALAGKIPSNKFHCIFAFPRGGWIVGVYLSHQLKIPLITDTQDWKILPRCVLPFTLFVDDIIHTGRTMKPLHERGLWLASLFCKEDSPFEPSYYVHKVVSDIWVRFPYELEDERPNR